MKDRKEDRIKRVRGEGRDRRRKQSRKTIMVRSKRIRDNTNPRGEEFKLSKPKSK